MPGVPGRGERIGSAFVRVFFTGDNSGIKDALDDDDLVDAAATSGERMGEAQGEAHNEAWVKQLRKSVDENEKLTNRFNRQLSARQGVITRFTHQFEDEFERGQQAILETKNHMFELNEEMKRSSALANAITRDFEHIDEDNDRIARSARTVTEQVRDFRTLIKNTDRDTDALRRNIDAIGDSIATSFGKGSRANPLNFFGVLVGRLATLFPRVLVTLRSAFTKVLGNIADNTLKAGSLLGGLGLSFLDLVGSIGFATAALGGFILMVGTLIAALSLAAGVVAALASSIAFGLAGALIPLAPLIFPVAAAIAGLVLGIKDLKDASKTADLKALINAFKGLKDLGKDVVEGFGEGLGPAVDRIGDALKGLQPVFHAIGVAFGDLTTRFINLMDKPGPTRFLDTFTTFIPHAIHQIGLAILNVTRALSNLFSAAVPSANDFLDWLVKITREFRKWTFEHPERIAEFIDRATNSAKTLFRFLGAVSDLLFEIIGAGRSTGDNIFDDMTSSIQGWVDAIRANPNILANWFHEAERFASAVGGAALAIADVFDALDEANTRAAAIELFKLLADVFHDIAFVVDLVNPKLIAIALSVGLVSKALTILITRMTATRTAMTLLTGSSVTVGARLTALGSVVRGLVIPVAGLGLSMLDAAKHGTSFGNVLGGIASGALIGGAVGGPFGALIGGAAGGGLTALAGAFHDTTDAAKQTAAELQKAAGFPAATAAADDLASSLAGVVFQYGEIPRAAALASLKSSETGLQLFNTLRAQGVSGDTISRALLGQGDAIKIVNQNLREQKALLVSNRDAAKQALDTAIAQNRAAQAAGEPIPNSIARIESLRATWKAAGGDVKDFNALMEEMRHRIDLNTRSFQDHVQQMKNLADQLGITLNRYKQLPRKVRTEFEEQGLPETRNGITDLIEKFKGLQNFRDIKMLVRLPGIDLTLGQIKRLAETAKLTPKQITMLLHLEGFDLTAAQLKKINADMATTNGKTATPKVNLNHGAFDAGINHVKTETGIVGALHPIVKVTADTTAADRALQGTLRAAQLLNTTVTTTVNIRRVGGPIVGPGVAAGGIFTSATRALIGEAGPEAVVPLNRPLAQVDPAVRSLSAIAQGISVANTHASNRGRTVDVGGITIVTPNEDPQLVAFQVVNRIAAASYI